MIEFSLQKKLQAESTSIALNVSCKIEQGQFVGLYGSSGAGKTSVLKMLAGFLSPDVGFIKVNDEDWFNSDKKINIAPQKRHIGFVFQDNALFPNMTVVENLTFALDKGSTRAIIDELMSVVELEAFYKRRVQTLSGGQKQRVALARALVRKPQLLLLDEPLSAIDQEMRLKLQDILLNIHHRYHLNTILVSHDVAEIVRLCDQVIVLNNGEVANAGEPAEIFFPKQNIPGLSFHGNIIKITTEGNIHRLSILAGNEVIKITVDQNQTAELNKGDRVLVSISDFTPFIKKL